MQYNYVKSSDFPVFEEEFIMKKSFWKTMKTYTKGYEKHLTIGVVFSLITGVAVAAQPLIIKYIVDDGIMAPLENTQKMKAVGFFCIVYLLFAALRFVAFGIAYNSSQKLMEGSLCSMRNAFFEKIQHLSMSFYDKTASGELFNCIMGSPLNNIKTFLHQCVISIPYQSVSFVISLGALFSYDIILTSVLLGISLIMVLLNHISKKKIKKIAREYITTESESSKYISDMLHGLEATKIYSVENDTISRFETHTNTMKEKAAGMAMSIWFEQIKPEGTQFLGIAAVYFVGAFLCIYRGLSTGVLFAFITSMGIILSTLSTVLQILLGQGNAAAGLEKIQSIIDSTTDTPETPEGRARNIDIERESAKKSGKPCIEFENASFGYDSKTIYDKFNCKINYNESIGLVGGSGSGKSTFTKLIMRLYDVDKGALKLHGRDIKDFQIHDMRKSFGVVPQNPFMFQCSIMENIRIARPEASNQDVIKAMEIAHVHEFVNELPMGWNTIIGDGGLSLSGGQKQRIAIARAVLGNPDILIFDEATSALDNISEKLIQESMEELMKDHTVIIVAHRLTTIRNVDRILVFENGNIVEEGNYDTLVSSDGKFKELLTFKS